MAHVAILYSSAVAYVGILYMGTCILAIVLPGGEIRYLAVLKERKKRRRKKKRKKAKRYSVEFIISPAGQCPLNRLPEVSLATVPTDKFQPSDRHCLKRKWWRQSVLRLTYATVHSWRAQLYLYDQLRESLGGGVGKQKPGVNSAL